MKFFMMKINMVQMTYLALVLTLEGLSSRCLLVTKGDTGLLPGADNGDLSGSGDL